MCITFELELFLNDYIILPFYEGKKCDKIVSLNEIELLIKVSFNI